MAKTVKQVEVRWPGNKGPILVTEECRDMANEIAVPAIDDAMRYLDCVKSSIDNYTREDEKPSKTVAEIPAVHFVSELIPYVSDEAKKNEYLASIEPWIDSCTKYYPCVNTFWCNSLGAINTSMSGSQRFSSEIVYAVKDNGDLLPLLQMACMLMEHAAYTIPYSKECELTEYWELRNFLFPHNLVET